MLQPVCFLRIIVSNKGVLATSFLQCPSFFCIFMGWQASFVYDKGKTMRVVGPVSYGRGGGASSLCLPSLWFYHWTTLQRQNSENSKQIFPDKELHGLSPKTSSVCERFICIPWIGLSTYSAAGNSVDRSWEHINRSQTHECGNWDWGPAISFLEMKKWDFRCSAMTAMHPTWKQISQQLFWIFFFFANFYTENPIFQKLYCFFTFFAKYTKWTCSDKLCRSNRIKFFPLLKVWIYPQAMQELLKN